MLLLSYMWAHSAELNNTAAPPLLFLCCLLLSFAFHHASSKRPRKRQGKLWNEGTRNENRSFWPKLCGSVCVRIFVSLTQASQAAPKKGRIKRVQRRQFTCEIFIYLFLKAVKQELRACELSSVNCILKGCYFSHKDQFNQNVNSSENCCDVIIILKYTILLWAWLPIESHSNYRNWQPHIILTSMTNLTH